MNALILCVGKLKERWQADGCAEYLKRLSRYGKYEVIAVDDARDPANGAEALIRQGMEKEGAVRAYLMEAPNGRQRKYYHLTEQGKGLLQTEKEEWQAYSRAVNAVLSSALGTA